MRRAPGGLSGTPVLAVGRRWCGCPRAG